MKKFKVLVADNFGNGHRKNILETELKNQGLDVEVTIAKNEDELKLQNDKFNIILVDWLLHKSLNNLNTDHICILSSSEDIKIVKYAMENQYSFMYKPINMKKITDLIINYAYN